MLEKLISESDLTVSLLPYAYHVKVAKLCIKHKKHLITTSYVSDEMKALDNKAKDADIMILNECGLDPGIDHMSAMRVIHNVEENGGKVLGFDVRCIRQQDEFEILRYLIPMAAQVGAEVRMHIQDLPFASGEIISLIIRAIDSAGNVGAEFSKDIRLSANPQAIDLPKPALNVFVSSADRPEINGLQVAVVDLVDKIDPRSGEMLPHRPEGYKVGNHLFSANKKTIRVQAARNETVFLLSAAL